MSIRKGSFEYKGINSLDMYLKIENDIAFSSPEADIDLVDILGRDGELVVNNNRLKGNTFPIPVVIKIPNGVNKTVSEVANDISGWLKNDISWSPLTISSMDGYEYEAIMYEKFDIVQTLETFGRTVLNFRIKPYKKRTGSKTINMTTGQTLSNPELRPSKPLIRIEGTGEIKLKNNGRDWLFINQNGGVDGHIIIDSELMQAFKDVPIEPNRFNRMYGELPSLFPMLAPGNNLITWTGTGTITKVTIDPRWEAVT